MPTISQCLKARSQITKFALLNNSIAYTTKIHGLKLFSKSDCQVTLNFSSEFLNSQTELIAFSPDEKYIALFTKGTISIVSLSTKELIQSINVSDITITHMQIDLTSSYIILGTKQGRILQYKYDDATLLARVFSYKYQKIGNYRGNIISTISFYKEYQITAFFDGTINIVNLHTKVQVKSLKHSHCTITTICMLNDNILLSGDSQGNLYSEDINDSSSLKEIYTPFTSISQIIPMTDPDYILVSSPSNTIAVVNIKTRKLIHIKYIEFKEDIYSVLLVDEEHMIVALNDNSIVNVYLSSISKLRFLIQNSALDKAYELADKNLMLYETHEYKTLQKNYKEIYIKAAEALINQNKKQALFLTDPFKKVECKKEEIKLLYGAYDKYSRFQTLFLEKKITLGYNMVAKFPALQFTNQYKKMEKQWKEIFLNAQRHILLGNKHDASTLLSDYMTIAAKRPLIKLILNENKLFLDFLKATEEKDFKKVNELAKKNVLLSQLPTYKVLEDSIDITLKEIKQFIISGEIEKAKESINTLHIMPSIASRVKVLLNEANDVQRLSAAYIESDFQKCYEILDNSAHLSCTELGGLLNKHWVTTIKKCENFSLKGNIKGVKKTLTNLMSIQSRKEKIGDLLRVSFHVKIGELTSNKKYKSAENIIYSYLDIFGDDNEISKLMKKYEKMSKKTLAITELKKISRDSWMNSDIIMK